MYIDKQPYECFFGGPALPVLIDGQLHTITVDGPEPKVKIGESCKDLVPGRIKMIIDGKHSVDVYLDNQIQTFTYEMTSHTLQVADYFSTILIDGIAITNVDYGGLPRNFKIGNKKVFIRFSTLPKGVSVGKPPEVDAEANPSSTMQSKTENPLKIDDLLQKLLSSGLISNLQGTTNTSADTATIVKPPTAPSQSTNSNNHPKKREEIVIIDFKRPETIKKRSSAAVEALFCGMQCSSCGVRFPPEQTMKYSQHLDWHFRQNRRDRDASKRAHSRKWYYDVSDWIQYEEIEDLEDREQNWFEKQDGGSGADGDANNILDNETPNSPKAITTCLAGPKGADETCDVCHDRFEYFFNEETEDWHLKNAMRVDDKIYHPTCHEDKMASEERALNEALNESSKIEEGDETEEPKAEEGGNGDEEEYVPEDTKLENMEDDDDFDDDVIALSPQKPTITEILDDEDDENGYRVNEIEDTGAAAATPIGSPKENTKEVEEKEPTIDPTQIKVKEEKIDDSYETFDPFEDVGTMEDDPDIIMPEIIDDEASNVSIVNDESSNLSPIPAPTTVTTTLQNAVDGNCSLTYAPPITVNKIRINMTKPPALTKAISPEPKELELVSASEMTTENAADKEKEIEIEPTYSLKPSMADTIFNKLPPCEVGNEASGLCSIM